MRRLVLPVTLCMLLGFGVLLKPVKVIEHGLKAVGTVAGEIALAGLAIYVCAAACR